MPCPLVKAAGAWRWTRSRLRRPWTGWALAALLAADVAYLRLEHARISTIAQLVPPLSPPLCTSEPPALVFERAPDGPRFVDTDAGSADALARLLTATPDLAAVATLQVRDTPRGFWAPTVRRWRAAIKVAPLGPPLDHAEAAAIRRHAAAWYVVNGYLHPLSPAVAADISGVRILYGGLMHDALAALAFTGLVYWLLFAPGRGARRRARLLARGLCPACRYSLAGLPAGDTRTCPECGRTWPAPPAPVTPSPPP